MMSNHTLCELPSQRSRLSTLELLWQRTTDYLVLIENGNHQGFSLLDEARDWLIEKGQAAIIAPVRGCLVLVYRHH